MTEMACIEALLEELSPFLRKQHENRAAIGVWSKHEANDVLTEADEAIQRITVERIHQHFPQDRILGEELGMDQPPEDRNARCWIIDPIDGTQNFVRGLFPMFGISIAFAENDQVQAGGVDIALMGQRFTAARGQGAKLNGQAIRCSDVETLDMARVEIDFGQPSTRPEGLDLFHDIMANAGQVRCHCSAVVGLCSVACGAMDAYFHTFLRTWDFAAAWLIIEEAGGRLARLDGSALTLYDPCHGLIAANGHLLDECLNTLRTPAG